jgi:hypothetical protein
MSRLPLRRDERRPSPDRGLRRRKREGRRPLQRKNRQPATLLTRSPPRGDRGDRKGYRPRGFPRVVGLLARHRVRDDHGHFDPEASRKYRELPHATGPPSKWTTGKPATSTGPFISTTTTSKMRGGKSASSSECPKRRRAVSMPPVYEPDRRKTTSPSWCGRRKALPRRRSRFRFRRSATSPTRVPGPARSARSASIHATATGAASATPHASGPSRT